MLCQDNYSIRYVNILHHRKITKLDTKQGAAHRGCYNFLRNDPGKN
uniref:Uncharacterized protein n=1 Tax=Arundo donax TaxID=35708 RepID=A0A0A8XRJ5_ARUDO